MIVMYTRNIVSVFMPKSHLYTHKLDMLFWIWMHFLAVWLQWVCHVHILGQALVWHMQLMQTHSRPGSRSLILARLLI